MGAKKAELQQNGEKNEEKKDRVYEDISAKVVKVMTPTQADERITLVLDKEFETVDMKTGEEKTTNMFGMNVYNITNQVAASVPEIQLADTLAMGAMVNPQIIALALTNAEIVAKREFHEKGTKRESTNDVYANDCVVTKIVKVKTNILPIFQQTLSMLIATKPAVIKTAAVPNPFNM